MLQFTQGIERIPMQSISLNDEQESQLQFTKVISFNRKINKNIYQKKKKKKKIIKKKKKNQKKSKNKGCSSKIFRRYNFSIKK